MAHKKLKNIPHTADGLRTALFDELNGLRKGTTSLKRARTIAVLAHTILQTVMIGNMPNGFLLPAPKLDDED